MKALVISGGGAKVAWGGGTIQALYEKYNKDYDLVVGCSTGSLLMTLSTIKKMEELKIAYTSVDTKSIFKLNPFNKKGKVKILNAIWRLIRGKKSIGDSSNLLETIKQFYKQEDYDLTKVLEKEIVATVVNITNQAVEYKSNMDYSYEDMCEWIYTSACAPLFMSLVEKDGYDYVDGGIIEHIPVQYAIDRGATEIDVIVHRTEDYKPLKETRVKNFIQVFDKVIDSMHREISSDDIQIAKLKANNKEVLLNYYYTPYKLTTNSLLFDKKIMTGWWELGYNSVMEGTNSVKKYKLTKTNNLRVMK
jgi:NTE family protein